MLADEDLGLRVLDVLVFDLTPVEDTQDTGWPFDGDGPGVGQGFGDDEPFGAESMPVGRVVQYALDDPFGGEFALSESSTGEDEAEAPVAFRWDLLGSGRPPPFAACDLFEHLRGQGFDPRLLLGGGQVLRVPFS